MFKNKLNVNIRPTLDTIIDHVARKLVQYNKFIFYF